MQKYTAIIISSRDSSEFDRIYVLYTKEMGIMRVIGRGVRKPSAKLAGHLEPGTLSEVYVARARGMGQITGAITVENFDDVKKNFGKLAEFLKIAKFFLRNFAEEEKDEQIFELLVDFLSSFVEASEDKGQILVEAFWWKLFDALGNRPEVMKCVSCGERLQAKAPTPPSRLIRRDTFPLAGEDVLEKFFSVGKGGVVCQNCASVLGELFLVNDNQIKLLRVFLGNSLNKIVKVKAQRKDLKGLEKIRTSFEKYNFG